MNKLLEKLFEKTPILDEKDKYEITQIYDFINDEKKANMLKNWDTIVGNIIKIKEELRQKQEILLGKALENIKAKISKAKLSGLEKGTASDLDILKKVL